MPFGDHLHAVFPGFLEVQGFCHQDRIGIEQWHYPTPSPPVISQRSIPNCLLALRLFSLAHVLLMNLTAALSPIGSGCGLILRQRA
jgi:hypothetical protein